MDRAAHSYSHYRILFAKLRGRMQANILKSMEHGGVERTLTTWSHLKCFKLNKVTELNSVLSKALGDWGLVGYRIGFVYAKRLCKGELPLAQ